MVKFSHGCWHPAPDTIIDWAVEVVKGVANEDNLHFVTVSILSASLKAWDFK
jgi:alpha-D-xyloside xylohydrolase